MSGPRIITHGLSLALFILGVMTLAHGGRILFGDPAAIATAGDYVPFVVWGNVLGGPVTIVAAIALATGHTWGGRLAQLLAAMTMLLGLALALHVQLGGVFEARTVKALIVRVFMLGIAGALGRRLLPCAHADDPHTIH